jgi:hypothetical protein
MWIESINWMLASDSNVSRIRWQRPQGVQLILSTARTPETLCSGIRVLALEMTTHESQIRKAHMN